MLCPARALKWRGAKSIIGASNVVAEPIRLSKILIVDDEPLIAMLVEAWVADMGHEPVGPAHSLTEAKELLERQFDAAIIDLTLGDESGRPIAESLADMGVPFVYATGQAETQLDDLPRASGVLLKPYSLDAFETAVRAMLPGD